MRKLIVCLFAIFSMSEMVSAQSITVADVVARPGQTVEATIVVEDPTESYTGIQFDLQFPATGFSVAATGAVSGWNGLIEYGAMNEGKLHFSAAASNPFCSANIKLTFTVDQTVPVAEYDATVTTIQFERPGDNEYPLVDDVTFKVIVDNTIILDEDATTHPENAEGVDVLVKRTLKADVWNTLVLPFDMSNAQLTATFGDDVRVAKFTGWEIKEYDIDDNPTSISVKFTDIDAIVKNQPVIIKVSTAVDEFTVDGVDLEFLNNGTPQTVVGKPSQGNRGTFTGTYVPMVLDDPEDLFISNNKFYYSNGNSTMKGYRGYFWFQEHIVNPNASDARFNVMVGDESEMTGISNVSNTTDDVFYNMQGVRVDNPGKGLYIKNGKKVILK